MLECTVCTGYLCPDQTSQPSAFIIIFFCLSVSLHRTAADITVPSHFYSGHSLLGQTLATHEVLISAACLDLCTSHPKCVSYNYQYAGPAPHRCELNDATAKMCPGSVKPRTGFKYCEDRVRTQAVKRPRKTYDTKTPRKLMNQNEQTKGEDRKQEKENDEVSNPFLSFQDASGKVDCFLEGRSSLSSIFSKCQANGAHLSRK